MIPAHERPPTKRQREVLRAIKALTRRDGYAPSVRAIAGRIGVTSTNCVVQHLDALEARGLLTRTHGRGGTRTIRLVGACALCGAVKGARSHE